MPSPLRHPVIMIAHVAKLYVRPSELVADVTFNTGKSWTETDTSRREGSIG